MWLVLITHQMAAYEIGVNDCSNMVYRAESMLDYFNIDSMINEQSNGDGTSHVWLVVDIVGFQIPYESTTMTPIIESWKYRPDRVYNSTSEIIQLHPFLKDEYIK